MDEKVKNLPRLRIYETTVSKNWPNGRRPALLNDDMRLYTGFAIKVAAHQWSEIVTVHDGRTTTAYVTHEGFDMAHRGPAIHCLRGVTSQHRKAVREWFRDFCGREVDFV